MGIEVPGALKVEYFYLKGMMAAGGTIIVHTLHM